MPTRYPSNIHQRSKPEQLNEILSWKKAKLWQHATAPTPYYAYLWQIQRSTREQAITCEYHVWPMIWRFGELIVVRPLHWLEGWPLLEAPRCFVGSVASLELSNASHLRLREPRAAPQCPWQPNQSLQQVSYSEEIPSHLACCFESSKGYSYIEGHQGTSRDTKRYLIFGYLRDTKELSWGTFWVW